ncbi:5'/3'-nucleotidase SurE [Candidatus Liberibacter americanus]|uniref:5'-nucleotidase SurE n=1 Tax=Candidatus Liberibacter americanus str. Sao Paulo TaxID=1261131 RepID=U6B767_9HYPH|nr:5'/3'-nucleotidase SurE [Candidatus Liberibacter americanus]AHA27681.1 5-nucleotidase protein [Candidatus Liberibacter americanus str. Sao Paulo]EMS36389.1 stationary phase survival protein SurE [Candidatus Liberibacter americanus PW_SP]
MRILLTNDDGIRSEGLVALEKIARSISDDIWICAPEMDQSCLSNSLTMYKSLSCRMVRDRCFAVRGTPVDCVIIALHQLSDKKPDLILSGVNIGTNTANHIAYSGTLAAAFEGSLQGISSLALSQAYVDEKMIPWEVSKKFAPNIIDQLLKLNVPKTTLFNINFPSCKPEKVVKAIMTEQGNPCFSIDAKKVPKDSDLAHYKLEFNDHLENLCNKSDAFAIKNNMISITPIKTNITDYDSKNNIDIPIKI